MTSPWTTVMTTAPRKQPTVLQSLESVRKAGFEPTIFAEPGSVETDAGTFNHTTTLGLWKNWLRSAQWAVEQNTPYILTLQDDVLLHPETRGWVEKVIWPCNNTGYISLYTSKGYSDIMRKREKTPGVVKLNSNALWGALAIVWPREVLQDVLEHDVVTSWRGPPNHLLQDNEIKNADTVVGCAVANMHKNMWFMFPSLATHSGRYSTVDNQDNTGRRNSDRPVSFNQSLEEQLSLPSVIFEKSGLPKKSGHDDYDEAIEKVWELGTELSFALPWSLWREIDIVLTSSSVTLEFGAGASTFLFKKYNPTHIALEQNEVLARNLEATFSPLVDGWYTHQFEEQFDVILVDGPHQGVREQCIPFLQKQIQGGAIVFIDDLARKENKKIVEAISPFTEHINHNVRWAACYPNYKGAKNVK